MMVESETAAINPSSAVLTNKNAANKQQMAQAPSTSSSTLLIPGASSSPLLNDKIMKMENQYCAIAERLATLSDTEMCDYLMNNAKNGNVQNEILDGIFCALLIEPQNASKYLNFIAPCTNGWNHSLYNMNYMLLEVFHILKPQFRQNLVQLFAEILKFNVPGFEICLSYLFRALSDGAQFRETCQLVQSVAQIINANSKWLLGVKKNSLVFADIFAFMSRFIADLQLVAGCGVPVESFKATLITTCELLVRERFAELAMTMGQDLVIALMRLSKLQQFWGVWKMLLHNPSQLMPNLNLQQQLMIPPSTMYLGSRVSVHISRKIEWILKQIGSNVQNATKADFSKCFEPLKNTHLSGPDSGTMRAEIIRHIWVLLRPEEFHPSAIEARAALLAWLLRTSRVGAEQQWCKLMLFWEWFGFDARKPDAHIYIEPAFSTTRSLLSTHSQIGNSLVDFLIRESQSLYPQLSTYFVISITAAFKSLEKANIPIHTLLAHPRLEQPLKDQLRSTFPELFPKKVVSIADNLAEPSTIIDFDAIRNVSAVPTPNGQEVLEAQEPTPAKKPKLEKGTEKADVDQKMTAEISAAKKLEKKGSQSPPLAAKVKKHHHSTDGVMTTKIGKKEHHPGHIGKRKRQKSKEEVVEKGGERRKDTEEKKEKDMEEEQVKPTTKTSTYTMHPLYTQAEPSTSTATHEDDLVLTLSSSEEQQHDGEEMSGGEHQRLDADESTKLDYLLPMVREEFSEHLVALDRLMRKSVEHFEEAGMEMDDMVDSILEADEFDTEQAECIALCLARIFSGYLRKKSVQHTEFSDKAEIENQLMHPIYQFFKLLVQHFDSAELSKPLYGILAKLREECPRLGYLFLFYLRKIHTDMNLSRRDSGREVERVVDTYKAISDTKESSWEESLIKDLERCSFEDPQLFSLILPCVLSNITPYGPPPKLMRLICATIDPRQLSQLMSEIVRENIVLFPPDSILSLLHDSLKWESIEQFMVWQLVQVEAVEFDKFLDLLQRLSYSQHPEATAAILVIIRNMEPNPDPAVMRSLLRNLLLRPPDRDLFTVDALKLLVDYEDNVPPMSDSISKFVKTALHNGDILAPTGQAKLAKGRPRVLTVEAIIDHLDRFRQHCMDKESKGAENLFNNPLFLEMFSSLSANAKLGSVRNSFEELFALTGILLEDKKEQRKGIAKSRRGGKGRGGSTSANLDRRKKVTRNSDSDED